ncbi:MAG: cell division protein FtsL [Caldisericia bacterium]|nr:cell division protein FtsL [Caldisericia bacterium]
MQNLEWFKKFSLFLIIIIFFIFIYGFLNFYNMHLEKKKEELKRELNYLKEEYLDLTIEYEKESNPKNLIEKAVNNLKLKFGEIEVIVVDTGNGQ